MIKGRSSSTPTGAPRAGRGRAKHCGRLTRSRASLTFEDGHELSFINDNLARPCDDDDDDDEGGDDDDVSALGISSRAPRRAQLIDKVENTFTSVKNDCPD